MDMGQKLHRKALFSLIAMLPTAVFLMIAKCCFSDIYLFEWMLRHPLVCFLPVLVACVVNAGGAFWVSCANVVAIVMGQFLGDWLRERNLAKITADMEPWVQMRLGMHKGFAIWLEAVLVVLAVFCLLNFVFWLKGKPWEENQN